MLNKSVMATLYNPNLTQSELNVISDKKLDVDLVSEL